jgi:hypothetical protein
MPTLKDAKPLLPSTMRFFGAGFSPPMALGALSGEYQKLGWAALNNWLDFTKDANRRFIPDELRSFLHVNVDAFMVAVRKFEEAVPIVEVSELLKMSEYVRVSEVEALDVFDSLLPLSFAEEAKLLHAVQAKPQNVEVAERNCNIIMHYFHKVLLPRRCRMLHHVRSVTSPEIFDVGANTNPVSRALARFLRPGPLPDTVVHDALLDLATSGWQFRYYNVNLQLLRELIFKQQTATADDLKAFLYSLILLGEEITPTGA